MLPLIVEWMIETAPPPSVQMPPPYAERLPATVLPATTSAPTFSLATPPQAPDGASLPDTVTFVSVSLAVESVAIPPPEPHRLVQPFGLAVRSPFTVASDTFNVPARSRMPPPSSYAAPAGPTAPSIVNPEIVTVPTGALMSNTRLSPFPLSAKWLAPRPVIRKPCWISSSPLVSLIV